MAVVRRVCASGESCKGCSPPFFFALGKTWCLGTRKNLAPTQSNPCTPSSLRVRLSPTLKTCGRRSSRSKLRSSLGSWRLTSYRQDNRFSPDTVLPMAFVRCAALQKMPATFSLPVPWPRSLGRFCASYLGVTGARPILLSFTPSFLVFRVILGGCCGCFS